MAIKIGSVVLDDVFVGTTASTKTNVDKIVIGNANGTGNTLWERNVETGPWNSGYWYTDYGCLVWDKNKSVFDGFLTVVYDDSDAQLWYTTKNGWILSVHNDYARYTNYTCGKYAEEIQFNEVEGIGDLWCFWYSD